MSCHSWFYYIQSNEIQENIDEIYCIIVFSLVKYKILYFHSTGVYIQLFWITSDFSINLLQCTSELQTPITFLFVDENIECGNAFS